MSEKGNEAQLSLNVDWSLLESEINELTGRPNLTIIDIGRMLKTLRSLWEKYPKAIRQADLAAELSMDRATLRRTLEKLQALLGRDCLPSVGAGHGIALKFHPKGIVPPLCEIYRSLKTIQTYAAPKEILRFHVAAPGSLADHVLAPVFARFRQMLLKHPSFKDQRLELKLTHGEVSTLISSTVFDPTVDCVLSVLPPDASIDDESISIWKHAGGETAKLNIQRCIVFPTGDPLEEFMDQIHHLEDFPKDRRFIKNQLIEELKTRTLAHLEDAQVASYQWFPWDLVQAIASSDQGTTLPLRRHSEIISVVQLSSESGLSPSQCDRSDDRKRTHVVGLALQPLLSRDDAKTCSVLPLGKVLGKGGNVPICLLHRANLLDTQKGLVDLIGEQFHHFATEYSDRLAQVNRLGRLLSPFHHYKWIQIATIRDHRRTWVTEPVRLWGSSGAFVKGFRWRRVPNTRKVERREIFARVSLIGSLEESMSNPSSQTMINLVWRETIRNEYGLPEFIDNQAPFMAQFTCDASSIEKKLPLVGIWQGSVRGSSHPFGSSVILSADPPTTTLKEINEIADAHFGSAQSRPIDSMVREYPVYAYPIDICE